MRKANYEHSADDMDGLDFSINIQGSCAEEKKEGEEDSGWSTKTGWAKLRSTPDEENARKCVSDSDRCVVSSGEAFNRNISTPTAASISSDQFKHLNEEGLVDTLFSTALNPVACLFHLAFKGTSIFCFIFLNALINEEILTFIVVVTLAAFDFWTVKNVTGRLLVNLRWDSHID